MKHVELRKMRKSFLIWGLGTIWLSLPSMQAQTTERVYWPVGTSGLSGAQNANLPRLSSDGRFVAFSARNAGMLAGGDANNGVFRYDRQTQQTVHISISSDGKHANGITESVSMSGDGRYVCFSSMASNLVAGDTNNTYDVFVRDCQTAQTQRVSVSSGKAQLADASMASTISLDGRYVFFESEARAVQPNAPLGLTTILVFDRQSSQISIAALNNKSEPIRSASLPSVSRDGRYMAFRAIAQYVTETSRPDWPEVWVRDMQSGRVALVSADLSGNPSWPDMYLQISADGRYVVFSSAGQLVPGTPNGQPQIYIRDITSGRTSRVSVNSAGEQADGACSQPVISGDGRYVAFLSSATNLLPDALEQNGQLLYMKDLQTGSVSLLSTGVPGVKWTLREPRISENGLVATFSSIGGAGDASVYVRDRPAEPWIGAFPHYANGAGAKARIILTNGGGQADTGEVRFRDSLGNASLMPIAGQMLSNVPYSLPPFGSVEIQTDGSGALKSGTVQVLSDRGWESSTSATLVFDVFGKFVSVDSCPPWPIQRFYASRTSSEDTGLAVQNPGPYRGQAKIELHSGTTSTSAQLTLEPGEQKALFLNDSRLFGSWFASHPGDFKGWIEVTEQREKALVAIGLIQRRNTGALIAVAPTRFVPGWGDNNLEEPPLYFPQFANGEVAGTKNRTRVILNTLHWVTGLSSSDGDSGKINFRDADGKPSAVPFQGGSQSSVDFNLTRLTVKEFETTGQGPVKSGSVEVVSNGKFSRLEGSEVFDVLGNFVSLNPSPKRTTHQVYVSFTAEECTGLAAYNPASEAISIDAFLLDSAGQEKASKLIQMPANKQFAWFIDAPDLFRTYFNAHPGDFHGTLNLRVRDSKKVAVVGLIQKKATGALIAVTTGRKAFSR